MFVVMMVLLSTSALAVFAVHATSYEIRASGYVKRATQTRYVAESGLTSALSWVDRWGPAALLRAMHRTALANQSRGEPALSLSEFHEPPLAQGKEGYRIFADDLRSAEGPVVDLETVGGARQAYDAAVYVDVYDAYQWTGVVVGERGDGEGQLKYLRATYTARGRTRIRGGDVLVGGDPLHESAVDARAVGMSGPFGG